MKYLILLLLLASCNIPIGSSGEICYEDHYDTISINGKDWVVAKK